MATQDNVLRLLVAEESLNDAEMLISVLRNAGYAVRAVRVEDDEELQEALQGKVYDLFLCAAAMATLPLMHVKKVIQQAGKDIPIVGVHTEDDLEIRREVLEAGAADLVSKTDLKHLQLVVTRELTHLHDRRRLRRLESALREVEKRCHVLLDSSRDAIAYVHEGMHIYANRAYLEKFGYASMEDIEGMPLLDMASPKDQARLKDFLRGYQKEDAGEQELELNMLTEQDEEFHVLMTFSPASIEGEPCTQILMREKGMTQEMAKQLDTLSKQDLLTGLYNRSYFMEQLEQSVGEAVAGSGKTAGLIYLQLDNLDAVRQTMGISGVDLLVSDIGALVGREVGQDGVAARFGDEVFTVLLPSEGVHEAIALAEALRQAVEEHVAETEGRTITTSCSIGVTMVAEKVGSAAAAVNEAHEACEEARRKGGNQVHLHAPAEEDAAAGGGDWAERIRAALADHAFFLVYQPVASLQGDSKERYEVRVRLREGEKVVMPAEFVAQTEQAGMMPAVDRWVVATALAALAKRRGQGKDTIMFVKISGPTLADPQFAGFLAEQLKAHKVEPERLVFQLNEPVAVTQLNQAKEMFRQLKTLRCGFALDHFGSGLNPFQLVKHLPADYLKVDSTLTTDLGDSAENQASVKQLIENAHAMQKKVIAGYLEDASSLAILWQYGTDFVQGYFLAEPEPEMSYDFSGMVI